MLFDIFKKRNWGSKLTSQSDEPGPVRRAQRNGLLASGAAERAQGCLLGQLAGDALGSLVEFKTPQKIRRQYPRGVRNLENGGTWNTIAGQPTDDSELALALARSILALKRYEPSDARKAYVSWLQSNPFDCGITTRDGLLGKLNRSSQANGAMMRACPLGIFGAGRDRKIVMDWAAQDGALTHPNIVCQQANALYVAVIAQAISTGCDARTLYEFVLETARGCRVESALMTAIKEARDAPPSDFLTQQGWVLIAFRNALWHLCHTPTIEDAIIVTVMQGGDTDTNAAICGALLGAVYGRNQLPDRWITTILNCRPRSGQTNVMQPRPELYWPVDADRVAIDLLRLP